LPQVGIHALRGFEPSMLALVARERIELFFVH
jgi:hypothetical protein